MMNEHLREQTTQLEEVAIKESSDSGSVDVHDNAEWPAAFPIPKLTPPPGETHQCDLHEEDIQALVRYWITQSMSLEMHTFLTCWTGGSDVRRAAWGFHRFEVLRKLLPDDALVAAMDHVENYLSKEYGDEWHVFKTLVNPGILFQPINFDAIKRLFCEMVRQLPQLGSSCDTDGYSMIEDYYCLGAAMNALRDCSEVVPPLTSACHIPSSSTYSQVVELVEKYMQRWYGLRGDRDVYDQVEEGDSTAAIVPDDPALFYEA